MTEDEAKTKLCFKAATFGGSQQLADGAGPFCVGSACMGWRVRYNQISSHDLDGPIISAGRYGYCGPAGEP